MIWNRLFPSVRRAERERFRFFFLLSGFLVLGQTLGLVGAESLLLAHLGASVLPGVFILASCVTVLASLLYAFGVDRARNDNYFINLLLAFAGAVAIATLLNTYVPSARNASLVGLFCLYYASFAVCTSHYWTFTGDFFDSIGAKRLFPLFTIGASLGGLIGGGIASLVATRPGGANELLWGWVASSLLAAVWLRKHRGPLRRWGPLEIEEADETSVDGMKSSLRFLQTSRLGKLLVLSALFMVTSLFVSQYIYSSLFVAQYPEPDQLAKFFGIFLAAANACELVLEVAVTPWLLSRFGIANANLFHPFLTLISFLFLGMAPGLGSAVFARLNRETLENAVGAPVRNLLFNALPARLRGRMRAFLEGMVVYSGMAFAGLFLLIWEKMHATSEGVSTILCAGGFALACGFFLTNYGLKKDYLEQLIRAIREGRLELSHSLSTLETVPSRQLVQLWTAVKEGATQSILERISRGLLERGLVEPLQESFAKGGERVRLVCLKALVEQEPFKADLYLRKALEDEAPKIRLFALTRLPASSLSLAERALKDPDPEVRAEAASRCSPPHLETLQEMLESEDFETRVAALRRVPEPLLEHAQRGLDSDRHQEVQASLQILCRHSKPPEIEKLETLYMSASPQVRVEALSAVLSGPEPAREGALDLLFKGLSDTDRHVRRTAAARFALAGAQARPILTEALGSPSAHICHNAIRALATWGDEEVSTLFGLESIRRAKRAWVNSVEAAKLSSDEEPGPEKRFLILAMEDAASRDLTACFRLLEVLEEEKIVRSVEKVLRFAHARIRADALEVLSNLGVRESTSILVHLLEEGDIVERAQALAGKVPAPKSMTELLEGLSEGADRWLALAAQSYQRSLNGEAEPPGSEDALREETVLMEHLLMLRNVPLFATMTLEQLEAIHHCLSEQHYTRGELIFGEGDVGDEMYIVVEGEVDILINLDSPQPLLLTTVGPDSYFGEMSILDNEPRSAAARTATESRLLVLKGEQLKELVFIMPEIAFTIFKVLSERLRRSDKRLDHMARDQNVEDRPVQAPKTQKMKS